MNIFIIFNSIDNAVVAVFLGVAGHAQGQKSYKLIWFMLISLCMRA